MRFAYLNSTHRKLISKACNDVHYVKFAPEHNAHYLEAEKLRFKLQNQLFLSKDCNKIGIKKSLGTSAMK